MKHWTRPRQTGSLRTGPRGAKSRRASPNHHVGSALFWDITQCRVTILYWYCGTNCWSHLQQSRNLKETTVRLKLTDTLFFFGALSILELCYKRDVSEADSVSVFRQWTPNLSDPSIELFSITGHHRNSNLLRYVLQNKSSPRVVTGKLILEN